MRALRSSSTLLSEERHPRSSTRSEGAFANLKHRLRNVSADTDAGRLRLCFGSKKLWRSQYHLEANGYRSHTEWLADWRDARSNEFFVLGSRDETAGCQLCVAIVADDGSLTLRLRLPDCLAQGVRQVRHDRERTLRLWARAHPGSPAIECGLQGISQTAR